MSLFVMTKYLYYFVLECIISRISALWSMYCVVLMLSVHTWWYHRLAYVRRSGVPVPARIGAPQFPTRNLQNLPCSNLDPLELFFHDLQFKDSYPLELQFLMTVIFIPKLRIRNMLGNPIWNFSLPKEKISKSIHSTYMSQLQGRSKCPQTIV